jgi:osmotically-inducible protein OsmY
VKDGEVTLSGTVVSRGLKYRAEDLAELASGVRHVQNNLRVESSV